MKVNDTYLLTLGKAKFTIKAIDDETVTITVQRNEFEEKAKKALNGFFYYFYAQAFGQPHELRTADDFFTDEKAIEYGKREWCSVYKQEYHNGELIREKKIHNATDADLVPIDSWQHALYIRTE